MVYKAFENMDGFRRFFGVQPNTRAAVLVFGLFHGFGLATKLQEFALSPNGLVANIVSFNVGVEIGQGLALTAILIALTYWRTRSGFMRHAFAANAIVMAGGFLLIGYQLSGYFLGVGLRKMGSEVIHEDTVQDSQVVEQRHRIAVAAGAALLVAGLVLVMFVLPAEFAVDPLGTGARFGLLDLGITGQQVEALENAGAAGDAGDAPRSSRRRMPAFSRRPWSSRSPPATASNTSTGSTRARRCSTRGRPPGRSTRVPRRARRRAARLRADLRDRRQRPRRRRGQ